MSALQSCRDLSAAVLTSIVVIGRKFGLLEQHERQQMGRCKRPAEVGCHARERSLSAVSFCLAPSVHA